MNITKNLNAAFRNPFSVPWRIFNILRRKFPLDYWLFNGLSFPPDIVTILITKRCNYLCSGCSSLSPAYTRRSSFDELTTGQIKKFIDEISWFKPSIYFNGGEPTLRDDLYDLIKYAKKKFLITALTTNGSLLDKKRVNLILDSKLDFLSVSLDGPASHHDLYRGFKGAYERLTEGVSVLIKERNKKGRKTPHVRITCIINPSKAEDALFVLKKAEELEVDEVAFGNLMFYPLDYINYQEKIISKHKTGGRHIIGFPVSNEKFPFPLDLKGLNDIYNKIKFQARIPVFFVPDKIDYNKFFSFKNISSESECLSPWFIATLLPDGNLTSCQDHILGNINDNSFFSLWNSEKMKKFRRFRKKTPFPACFRCLEGQKIIFD